MFNNKGLFPVTDVITWEIFELREIYRLSHAPHWKDEARRKTMKLMWWRHHWSADSLGRSSRYPWVQRPVMASRIWFLRKRASQDTLSSGWSASQMPSRLMCRFWLKMKFHPWSTIGVNGRYGGGIWSSWYLSGLRTTVSEMSRLPVKIDREKSVIIFFK